MLSRRPEVNLEPILPKMSCSSYFLRDFAYFYRYYVLNAMCHPFLCLFEALCLGHRFRNTAIENDYPSRKHGLGNNFILPVITVLGL